jgi:hypothetical protein
MRWLTGLALLTVLDCGGGADHATFAVEPESPVVAAGEQVQLTARPIVDLGGDLEWEVQERYGGGLLHSQGPAVTYVAPDVAGTYHLILRAPRKDGRPLKQILAVQVVGSFTLEPGSARVAPGGGVTFTARLKGLPKGAVRWGVQEPGGGEITEEGRYTAPSRHGTYHVTAVFAADPSVYSQATVTVGE